MVSDAEALNRILAQAAPGAFGMLSPLGLSAAFPKGIPFQSKQAAGVELNATIGQLTDGYGKPLPLDVLADTVKALDPHKTFLYSPVAGPETLRLAWLKRQRRLAGAESVDVSLPIATHGLTHGISVAASLFGDAETQVLIPDHHWGNYPLLFGMNAGCAVDTYPLFDGRRFDVSGLVEKLKSCTGKTLVVLNFPNNPTGYAPTSEEVAALVEVLASHPSPLVVLTDDAYQGFVYTDDAHPRSVFWDLAERIDRTRTVAVKVDGATKELLFFGSRLGFFTHTACGDAEQAMESKIKMIIRGTVGSVAGPSVAMVEHALSTPDLQADMGRKMDIMRARFDEMKECLDMLPEDVTPLPFNSAFFAVFLLPDRLDAEQVRQQLITEGVGVISLNRSNAIRVAYCSLDKARIRPLMERVGRALAS